MPIDAEPVEDGNMLVDLNAARAVVFSREALAAFRHNEVSVGVEKEPLYRSHFATCPQAGKWRRG